MIKALHQAVEPSQSLPESENEGGSQVHGYGAITPPFREVLQAPIQQGAALL